jgi:hypothetical protein
MQLKSTGRHLKRYRKRALKRYSFSSKLFDLSFILNKLLNRIKDLLNLEYNLFKKYLKIEFFKKINFLDNYFINSDINNKENYDILLVNLYKLKYKNSVLNNFFLIVKNTVNYLYYSSSNNKLYKDNLSFSNLKFNKFYFMFILDIF